MEYKDLFPPDLSSQQRLYCAVCSSWMTLRFELWRETVSGVEMQLQGVPMLHCGQCDRSYLPDRTRLMLMLGWENANKAGSTSLKSTRKKKAERFSYCEAVSFRYDSDDYYHIPGLLREISPGFLTPVFFRKEVLLKYVHDRRYSIAFASPTYGSIHRPPQFHISFGLNSAGLVLMWLGDLDTLPLEEQHYLVSENVDSDHDIGSHFYDAQIEAAFTQKTVERRMLEAHTELCRRFADLFGVSLTQLPDECLALVAGIDRLTQFDDPHLDVALDRLNKYFVESLSVTSLDELASNSGINTKNLKGLKLLSAVLRHNAEGAVSVATEIRVIPAESSGSPDQVFDGLGSAGYGGRKDAGWSWTSTPPTDRLSETDTLI